MSWGEFRSRVPDVIAEWADRKPESVALRTVEAQGADAWTYRELCDRMRQLRDNAFADLPQGARIVMAMTGSADYIAGFLAALDAGLVPVPVYLPSTHTPERYLARAGRILHDCTPSAVYTSADLAGVIGQDAALGTLAIRTPESLAGGSEPSVTAITDEYAESVAFLQYSSGSTGDPKGVVNTHESILRQAAFGASVWNRDEDMHTVSWLPLYHDMGIFWGVLIPLLNGGSTTLIPPHDFVRNPRGWLQAVSQFRGNWIAGPDFGYRRCVEAFDGAAAESLDLSCLRIATNGAEPIRSSTLRDFTDRFRPAGLRDDIMRPQYGLAEAGLGVTGSKAARRWVQSGFDAHELEHGRAVPLDDADAADRRTRLRVSCGDAAFGWDVRIVDPDRRVALSDGMVGEIWVGGAGLPQGYWRQPERTTEIFGATLLDGTGPYLRTGDAGFWYGGELYICGRYRDLIIVGGRNLFPNDIETTVESAHCGIARGGACAVQSDDASTDGSWWLVAETDLPADDLDDLSRVLRRRILANHETAPERIVWVGRRTLPMTTSGKIRRRETLNRLITGQIDVVHEVSVDPALPDTKEGVSDVRRSALADRVATLLGVHVGELDPDVDLTTLGLTSVTTAHIIEWSSAQSRRLDFADLYAEPTLRDWQRLFDAAASAEVGDLKPGVSSETWPTTAVQRAYWVGRGAEQPLGGVGCQTYFELAASSIDPDRLNTALDALVRRHPLLRSAFPDSDRCHIVPEPTDDRLQVHDLRSSTETARDAHLREVRGRLRKHRFDIAAADTWAVELTRLPDGYILHFAIDLIIADITSIGIMLRDLAAFYRGEELPAVSATFGDLICTAPALPGAVAEPLPEGPQLPSTEENGIVFRRHRHTLSAVAMKALDDACRDHGVTRAAAFLAAYTLVLRRWASQDDFLINVTTFGRSPQVSDVVGDFTRTHLHRARADEWTSFADQVQATQRGLRTALRTAQSTDLLSAQLRSGTGHSGLAPVVFTYAADIPVLGAGDADTLGAVGEVVSMTPQVLIDNQVCCIDDSLVVSWDYRAGCFPPGVVGDMFEAYVGVLECLGSHDWSAAVTIELSEHSRLTRQQRNATTAPAPTGLLYDAFQEQAASDPARVALRWHANEYPSAHYGDPIAAANAQLTYGQLDELACRVARAVSECHAPGSVVGIQLPKGPAQVVAVLGIMMAGCTYLPVGIDQPAERLGRICARSGMSGLIRVDRTSAGDVQVHDIESMLRCTPAEPVRVHPGDAAYVIYTSGSTGEPKGVLVSHAAASNTVADINRRNCIGADDTVLAVSALDFDLSVYDIFGPLSCGAHLVTISEQTRRDAFHWMALTAEFGVTVWNSVPGLMDMLLIAAGEGASALPSLRSVFLSGDWIPLDLPRRLRHAAPNARLVAMGGATEAAIWSNEFVVDDVDPDWVSVPYGYPLANQMFRVVDKSGHDQPDYVAGELWIGGAGVALGYHNAPELTAERFVQDSTGSRWYRTGDLGCYWDDGTLQFLGRADSQVKIRGHRVECGEIEHTLRGHRWVDGTVVVPIHNCTALGAVIVSADGATEFDDEMAAELRAYLADRLPQYMVPKSFVPCTQLPLTANGKIDRGRAAALVEAGTPAFHVAEPERGLTSVERLVAEVWSEVLGAEIGSPDDNFFTHGGDSLRATEVVARLTRRGVIGAQVGQLLGHQTLGEFSAMCVLGSVVSEPPDGVPEATTRETEFPLTRLQQAYALGAAGLHGSTSAPTHFAIVLAAGDESGHLDLTRLAGVVDRCVDEFALLRCGLATDTTQRVHTNVSPAAVSMLNDCADDPDTLMQHMATVAFEPQSVPAIRCYASSQSPRYVGLLINYLSLDARSLSTIVTTVIADYQAQPRPRPIDPTAAVFARFAADSQHADGGRRRHVAGPPMLPLDDRRPASHARVTFARRTFTLDADEADVLRTTASQRSVTPTALIFEAFAHALHAIGAGDRFAVTVPKSYRPDYAPADREVLGNFTRLTLCEVDYRVVPPGSLDAVAAAQRQLWQAVSQDDDAMDDLAATRRAGGHPVVFTSTLGLAQQDLGELVNVRTLTQTPGVWLDCQIEDEAAGIRLSWDVATDVVAEEPLSAAFSYFRDAVRQHAGHGTELLAWSPRPQSAADDWTHAVIADAVDRCGPEQVLPQYAPLVRRWESLRSRASHRVDHDTERAGRRLADIVTGVASPQTLIADPQLAPEAMLLRDERLQVALEDLADRVFAHARSTGRRLRILEVGSRTGLITQRITELVGTVVQEYLCLEPNPVLAEIARERGLPGCRHVDTPRNPTDAPTDVVICCGSLHQLPDAGAMLKAITVSDGGWLWLVENAEITPETLISAAVIDPVLLSADSQTLRPADRWWRLVAECGWQPTRMTQDGPGLTIVANRVGQLRSSPVARRTAHPRIVEDPRPEPAALVDQGVVSAIAEIWQRHLGVPTPTVDDDFFLLGGDSLVATRVYADLRAAGFDRLAFVDLFNYSMLGRLAAHAGAPAAVATSVAPEATHPRRYDADRFPLTVVQQAYRAGREGGLILGGVAAHCYFEFDVENFDLERFESAARTLVARHPGLRTTVAPNGTAVVHRAPIDPVVCRHDDPQTRMRHQVIDLTVRPGIDFGVQLLEDRRAVLGISMDNTMLDGASMMIALAELGILYRGGSVDELPVLQTSFAQYVWERPELLPNADETVFPQLAASRDYWRARLSSLPPAPPLVAAPVLFEIDKPEFERTQATIPEADWSVITRSCRAEGVTVASFLMTSYARVLSRWSGTDHFCVNVTLFDRDPAVVGIDSVIGDFTSLVLLECRIDQTISIWEQARRLQRQLMTDLPHRGADAVWLQRELLRHHGEPAAAIFPVVFTSGLGLMDMSMQSSFEFSEPAFAASQTPQTVLDFQVWENAGSLRVSWDFVTQAVSPIDARTHLDALVADIRSAPGHGRHVVPPPAESATVSTESGPDDELVQRVSQICAAALGRTKIDPGDNFFQLGGDSFTATKVVEQIGRELSPSATLRLLFANPIIGEFAAKLGAQSGPGLDPTQSNPTLEEGML